MEAFSEPFSVHFAQVDLGKEGETLTLARERAPDGDMKASSSHRTQLTLKASVSLRVVGSVCRDVGIMF